MKKPPRRAGVGDAGAVRECVVAAYSKYVERIGKKPAPMLDDYEALARAGDLWVSTGDDGEVLGVISMRRKDDHLFVENVAVHPEKQGRGLGRRLMDFAEDAAFEAGLSELRLYTNEKMRENVAFYEKLGFEEVERRTDGGHRRVFMRKRTKKRR